MPGAAIATLSKPELFARLADGLAGGVTMVTFNRRTLVRCGGRLVFRHRHTRASEPDRSLP